MLRLTYNTKVILTDSAFKTEPVKNAINVLKRDIKAVLTESRDEGADVLLASADCPPECFSIHVQNGRLVVEASDTLGIVYGIYAISRELLGVHDFWFWNDQHFTQLESIEIPGGFYFEQKPFPVRYRGWFINDEVLLATWLVERSKVKTWKMVFEALLRCGGNMVIPGTGQMSERNRELASNMGLIITHHHAEPLGAEMFARTYPDLNASYDEHPELFEELWLEGINAQKDMDVIWNLGFRGQGDAPFWLNDPRYDTDEARGGLISELIVKQFEMIKANVPSAVCCTNLYGETMELYQKGFLSLPEDIILIWADNGYGKMVSRRQGNHNPRVPALPDSPAGRHGVYYHVSFYDLQAANHITMLTNSGEFIQRELEDIYRYGVTDFWIINCSNIKPHVFYLSAIAGMWREGMFNINDFRLKYIREYYGEEYVAEIAGCFKLYEECAIVYGPNEDDRAAEQFLNHGTRILATQWIKDREQAAEEFLWACNAATLDGQMAWYGEKCRNAGQPYKRLADRCRSTAILLDEQPRVLFEDSILLHSEIYAYCCKGASLFTRAYGYYRQGNIMRAFFCAGAASEEYEKADTAMRMREHGKWNRFYANECLTDIKQTAWVLQGLMSWLRCIDDGPHYYKWQREFLYPESDKKVMLILNFENHLTDLEILAVMKEKWDSSAMN